jgi:hypothetical protein
VAVRTLKEYRNRPPLCPDGHPSGSLDVRRQQTSVTTFNNAVKLQTQHSGQAHNGLCQIMNGLVSLYITHTARRPLRKRRGHFDKPKHALDHRERMVDLGGHPGLRTVLPALYLIG